MSLPYLDLERVNKSWIYQALAETFQAAREAENSEPWKTIQYAANDESAPFDVCCLPRAYHSWRKEMINAQKHM